VVPPKGFSERYWTLVTSFLPRPTDTLLLRAVLLEADVSRHAWSAWCQAVGNPTRTLGNDRRHRKVLVPFIAARLRANGIVPDAEFRLYARAAHLTETLRTRVYLEQCARLLTLLTTNGFPHVVLKGPALAGWLYEDPALRHSHDLDVLPFDGRGSQAFALLRAHGFELTGEPSGPGAHHLPRLRNRIGLAVELHTRPTSLCPEFRADGVARRSREAVIAGVATRMPSLADTLILMAVHAVGCTSSASLRWVCELWMLAARMQEEDWEVLLAVAGTSHVALPLAITLGYLDEAIGPVVPPFVLGRLWQDARQTDRDTRSAIAYGARCSLPLTLRGIATMDGGWRSRFEQLAWRIAPPPRHVRWTYGLTRGWQVGLRYPGRFVSLAKQLAGRVS
jgi:hypothetical protein